MPSSSRLSTRQQSRKKQTLRPNNSSSASSNNGTSKAPNLPPSTVEYLKNWILSKEHVQHPYPNKDEKTRIVKDTGITLKQLKNWFVNNRRRFWKPNVEAKLRELDPKDPLAINLQKALVQVIGGTNSNNNNNNSGPKRKQRSSPRQQQQQQQDRTDDAAVGSNSMEQSEDDNNDDVDDDGGSPTPVSESDASVSSDSNTRRSEDDHTMISSVTPMDRQEEHQDTPLKATEPVTLLTSVSEPNRAIQDQEPFAQKQQAVEDKPQQTPNQERRPRVSIDHVQFETRYNKRQKLLCYSTSPPTVSPSSSPKLAWHERCWSARTPQDICLPSLEEATQLFGYTQ